MEANIKKALDALKKDKYVGVMFPEQLKMLEAALSAKEPAQDTSKVQDLLTKISSMSIEAKALLGGGAASPSSKSPRKARSPKGSGSTGQWPELVK